MNKIKTVILSIISICFLSFFVISSPSAEPELGGGRISLIQGQVLMQSKDGKEWTEASVNFPVMEGDRIVTERDGRVEFQFKNGTYVRMGEDSQVDVIALYFDQKKEMIRLYPLEGKIYVNHRPTLRENSTFQIDLPYGVIATYGPSRFRIDLSPPEAKISVFDGSIEVNRDRRPFPLDQGRMLILTERGYTEAEQIYGRDEWDRWNEARDRELGQRRYVQSYLPHELEPWAYEMENNGRWIYTPEYQYVWVPRVVVGWAPFRHGYWTWRRGIYCWVPYEPWGWVPFHYGRWFHSHVHGWVWVPPLRHAFFWHPGAVAWHTGPTHVSWIPLAPGEIYYGYRYYGPHSVNITRVNVNIQKNVFINARARDAVMTVHKDSFFKRNPVRVTQGENPFLRPLRISGPPIEKPLTPEKVIKPSRPIKEVSEKAQPERRFLPGEWRSNAPSIEKGTNGVEQKRFNNSSEKKTSSESVRGRGQKIEQPNRQTNSGQPNPGHEPAEGKKSTPSPMRESVRVENPAPVREGRRNIDIPIHSPSQIQAPPQLQEGKPNTERQSSPGGGSFSIPDSRGQATQQHRGAREGGFKGFSRRSFR